MPHIGAIKAPRNRVLVFDPNGMIVLDRIPIQDLDKYIFNMVGTGIAVHVDMVYRKGGGLNIRFPQLEG